MIHDENEEKKYVSRREKGCPIEEHYFGEGRKAKKQEKKIASAKDRSKYKKSDRDQLLKQEAQNKKPMSELLERGRVLSIVPEGILVDCNGQRYNCLLRGALKKEKGTDKNLVTVGDFVLFEITGCYPVSFRRLLNVARYASWSVQCWRTSSSPSDSINSSRRPHSTNTHAICCSLRLSS